MWNATLPPASVPVQAMPPASVPMQARPTAAKSPLRSEGQPYVAPPQPGTAAEPKAFNDGIADHGACFQETPAARPGMPNYWSQNPGAPTPPWQSFQHQQRFQPQYQQYSHHPGNQSMARPDLQGGN